MQSASALPASRRDRPLVDESNPALGESRLRFVVPRRTIHVGYNRRYFDRAAA
jgi:hypothetical protein